MVQLISWHEVGGGCLTFAGLVEINGWFRYIGLWRQQTNATDL